MTALRQNATAQPATEKGTHTALAVAANAPDALPSSSIQTHPAWPLIAHLPTLLAVAVPLCGLRVRDLLGLQPGQIVRTAWNSSEDAPLCIGLLQLGWGELDVLNGNIAFRITRLT
jgi:hypothetical protein